MHGCGRKTGPALDEWQELWKVDERGGVCRCGREELLLGYDEWVRGKPRKLQALWLQENLREGLPAWGLSTLSRGFGWSRERIEVLIARARSNLRDPNIHAYAECYVAYGRKPV